MTTRGLTLAAVMLAFACKGDDLGPLGLAHDIRIVASPGADTVQARPLQALAIEVLTADGRPKPGAVVRFSAVNPQSIQVAPISGTQFGSFAVDSADAQGLVAVLVAYGTVAGPARLVVAVPEGGISDTLTMTVNSGAPSSIRLLNSDTTVLVGAHFNVGITVTDRFGNPTTTTPNYQPSTGIVSVDQTGAVTATAVGRTSIVARSGAFNVTARISVVPAGRVLINSGGSLEEVNLDGTTPRFYASGGGFPLFPQAMPGGEAIAYHIGDPSSNSVVWISPSGLSVPRIIAAAPGSAWPRWSPDGQWVYYTTRDVSSRRALARVHPDGTGAAVLLSYAAPGGAAAPGASPDGRTVVLETTATNPSSLLFVDVATATTTSVPISCSMPQFASDGRIACLTSNSIIISRADGIIVARFPVTSVVVNAGVDWSPDGAWLVCTTGVSTVLVNAATGENIPLTIPFPQGTSAVAFVH